MKRKLFKSMIAAGAVAMICACGDDSASSNPATPIADNGCAKAVVTADAWLLNNWVIYADGNVTDLAGNAIGYFDAGIVMDLNGAPLAQNVNLADLTACAANASINPDTGLPVKLRRTRRLLRALRTRPIRRIRHLLQVSRIRPIRLLAQAPNL